MLIIYRPDCFIALISTGVKRNPVRAIRKDVSVDLQDGIAGIDPSLRNEVKQSVLTYAAC